MSHDLEFDSRSEERREQAAPAQLSLTSFGSTSTVDIPIDYECSAIAWAAGVQESEPLPTPNVPRVKSVSEPTVASTTSAVHAESRPHLVPKMSARSAFTGRNRLERRDFFKGLFHVWDNQFAMKLFGSRNGIKKEEERLKNCHHTVIHPCSKIRQVFVSP